MSSTRIIAASALALVCSPAVALDPPQNPQDVVSWNYVLDMNTADPADDLTTGFYIEPTGVMAIGADCTDFTQPPGQPKAPEGCGVFTPDPGDPGYWLYYDGDSADAPPGGWNASNRWWRNRLVLRVANDQLTFLGKPVANPASGTCADPSPCPGGSLKFCGEVLATDEFGTPWSGGAFSACVVPQ